MVVYMSRDHVEQKLSRLTKKKYNRYYWWRRYEYRNELPEKYPLKQRIINGDFDPSDYLYQAEHEQYLLEDKLPTCKNLEEELEVRSLFCERMRRLNEDYEKDEANIMKSLCSSFKKCFNVSKDDLMKIMESFDGTLEELYDHIKLAYEAGKREK
jgi:hypothetical protein